MGLSVWEGAVRKEGAFCMGVALRSWAALGREVEGRDFKYGSL